MLHTKYHSSTPSSFWEDFQRFYYFFSFWLPWQPDLWLEFNFLNNFDRALPKKHPCQVSSRLAQWFRGEKMFKEIVDDGRRTTLDARRTTHDGRRMTDIGRSQKLTMSTSCSAELKRLSSAEVARSLRPPNRLICQSTETSVGSGDGLYKITVGDPCSIILDSCLIDIFLLCTIPGD